MRIWRIACMAAVILVGASRTEAEDAIKIGVILPYSGVYASLGGDITDGMELAFELYGSEVAGRKIVLITEDSEVKPNVGLTKTKKLVFQDKVDLLVGPVASNVAGAMRDFVHNAKIPFLYLGLGVHLGFHITCQPTAFTLFTGAHQPLPQA